MKALGWINYSRQYGALQTRCRACQNVKSIHHCLQMQIVQYRRSFSPGLRIFILFHFCKHLIWHWTVWFTQMYNTISRVIRTALLPWNTWASVYQPLSALRKFVIFPHDLRIKTELWADSRFQFSVWLWKGEQVKRRLLESDNVPQSCLCWSLETRDHRFFQLDVLVNTVFS